MPDNSRKLKFLNILILFLLAVSSGLLTAYCSKDNEGGEGFAHVNMIDNSFSPPQIRIPVGGTIQFRNIGGNPHNAVAVDRKWGTDKSFGNLVMVRDNKVKIVFPEKGYYPYLCTFHASPDGKVGMVGSVIVGDGDYKPAGKSGEKFSPVEKWSETTRKVPGQYPTIQNAVDAAKPGDLILISEGVYKEEVVVTTPSLTIRGVDRNKVIIDGGYVHGNGIMVVGADGVAIENMTARNATLNGFYWTGVKGYRGSYLTAHNNGDYGLYAFDSVDGVIEHSYASGSPDSGFYIGQCYPCKAIINDVVSEYNALGYSGTNAGGELYIVSSVWRNNIVGLAPNTLDRELLPPERESTLVANLVYDNNNATAPVGPLEYPSFGNGIMIAGGLRNIIERNVIVNHINNGILLILNLDENFWFSHVNRVRNNTIVNSNRADMSIVGPMATGNCFSGNSYRTTIPPLLETFSGCGKIRYPQGSDLSM
ncbi:MAG: right-handed parallel beta-helix repeat-containing protein, partial [Leptospira sp.]|nr:right-handed parallel beta-helix repeat-containing protein [Leptospira sp.]